MCGAVGAAIQSFGPAAYTIQGDMCGDDEGCDSVRVETDTYTNHWDMCSNVRAVSIRLGLAANTNERGVWQGRGRR